MWLQVTVWTQAECRVLWSRGVLWWLLVLMLLLLLLLLIQRALLGVGGAAVSKAQMLLGALPPPCEVCTAGLLIPSVSLTGAGGESLRDWGPQGHGLLLLVGGGLEI